MGVGKWPLLDFIMISYLYDDAMADGVGDLPPSRKPAENSRFLLAAHIQYGTSM
jgi:hypothetical protein